MESPPIARYIPPNSKKRLFSGRSSSYMEPDVIEIVPPQSQRPISKSLKNKEVIHYEVIDIDLEEDSCDVMVIDEKVDSSKGKAVKNVYDGSYNNQSKEALTDYLFASTSATNIGSMDGFQSSENFVPASNNSNLDCFGSDLSYDDDEYNDFHSDDLMDVDYTILQAHLDSADIPPGVEVPIPWLSVPAQRKKKPPIVNSSPHSSLQPQLDAVGFPQGLDRSSSWWLSESAQLTMKPTPTSLSSFQTQGDAVRHPPGVEPTSPWSDPEAVQIKKKLAALSTASYSSLQTQKSGVTVPLGLEPSRTLWFPESSEKKKKQAAPSSSNYQYFKSRNKLLPPGLQPSRWGSYIPNKLKTQVDTSSSTFSGFDTQTDAVNLPPGLEPAMTWWQESPNFMTKPSFFSDPTYSGFYNPLDSIHTLPVEDAYIHMVQDLATIQENEPAAGSSTIPSELISIRGKEWNEEDILKKFRLFKQFDTVDDHSDHHFARRGSSVKQPPKNWAKKIQEEWRILENDLPDSISVRVYETRMDLLRAVIVGAEGTPYHDGLFFFDVFFPSGYPSEPPHVYYHSGGLRLNPNLYNCGKVCLSLLNTWSGNKNEKWIPGVSTMLQVLVSIQALILNAKPFFNEPGYASLSGSVSGEKSSEQYNEDTFIKSLKTMLYTLRRPPKHFEDFVFGHFCKHARDILVACKTYMDGAQVGSLVKGGVQDVDAGDKSCSKKFKENVAAHVSLLVQSFTEIGVKDCEKFLPLQAKGNRRAGRMPKAATPVTSL